MKIPLLSHIENAVDSLKSNRTRTLLTITGVTIGVASIVSVLSLAGGASTYLGQHASKVDQSVAVVRNHVPANSSSLLFDSSSVNLANNLTEQDVSKLSAKLQAKVAPLAIVHTKLSSKDSVITSDKATLIGSNENLATIASLDLMDGDFITSESTQSIIIGKQLAIDLFGTEQAIGNVINIRGQNFTVCGVLKPMDQPVHFLGVNFDNSAIISLSSVKQFTQNIAQIQQIGIKVDQDVSLKETVAQATEILSANHNQDSDFTVLAGSSITRPSGQLISAILVLMASVAGISLLVGGIGIMNIMLVNVAERQREIGIRKAIGATDAHVINQFLIESCIIGLLGGILGYAIGIGGAYAASLYLPFAPVLQWQVAAIGIGIATTTGVLFGIYPAAKATKKNPVESLRY